MSGAARSRPSRPRNPPELEIEHDEALLERNARIQHAAWIAMLVVLAAAVLGVFGSGPLSATERSAGGLTVAYQRFERSQRASSITVTFAGSPGGEAALSLPRGWLDRVRIESVSPEPRSESATAAGSTWRFATGTAGPIEATFRFVPERAGSVEGWVEREGGGRVPFRQFVWP